MFKDPLLLENLAPSSLLPILRLQLERNIIAVWVTVIVVQTVALWHGLQCSNMTLRGRIEY